jgi:hypothetical protein
MRPDTVECASPKRWSGLGRPMALVGATNEPLSDWFVTAEADRPPMDEVLDELTRVYVAVLG